MTGRATAALALMIALGCAPRGTGPRIYGPYEEGLTLTFEDPSRSDPVARQESRYQLRVFKGLIDPAKPGEVQITENTLQRSVTYTVRYEEGGRALIGTKGEWLGWDLPKGFPEKAQALEDPARAFTFRILGRAVWASPFKLPPAVDPEGVWVEIARKDGSRRRSLYLQGMGEVETLELRQGRWVAVNRLIARGFTDLPGPHAR